MTWKLSVVVCPALVGVGAIDCSLLAVPIPARTIACSTVVYMERSLSYGSVLLLAGIMIPLPSHTNSCEWTSWSSLLVERERIGLSSCFSFSPLSVAAIYHPHLSMDD